MREVKDSGVEWIGEIPANWKIIRLKGLFDFGKGLPITKENLIEMGIPVISYGQIHAKFNNGVNIDDRLFRFVSNSYLQTNSNALVNFGDILIADTSEDLEGCGNAVQIDRDTTIFAGYHTIILQSKRKRDNKYLAYEMLTDMWRSQLRSRATGVKLFSISRKMLGECIYIYPPIEDQQKIAAHLDRKSTQIDALISNAQQQIEKLKAYKQSVITETVTKGLDPDVTMKDSGVEWIGEIPEHWEIVRIKNICQFNPSSKKSFSDDDIVSYAPMECVRTGSLVHKEIAIKNVSSGLTYFEENDIIMAKVTPCFENGNIAIATGLTKGMAFGSSELFVFRANESIKFFLFYFLQNNIFKKFSISTMTGTGGLKRVSPNFVNNYSFALPPIEERNKIVFYLDRKCSRIDKLIALKQQKIEKLQQYKKSLIYEYVTGKKEV